MNFLLADENFNNRIMRGLLRDNEDLDIVRVQDTEVYQADDPTLLEWATHEGRIIITHDARTMPKYLYERLNDGKNTTGVIIVRDNMPIGEAISEILLLLGASQPEEFENQVVYLPL